MQPFVQRPEGGGRGANALRAPVAAVRTCVPSFMPAPPLLHRQGSSAERMVSKWGKWGRVLYEVYVLRTVIGFASVIFVGGAIFSFLERDREVAEKTTFLVSDQ